MKKPGGRRFRVFRIILVLAVIYAGWLAYEIVSYKIYMSPPPKSPAPGQNEVEGVYHIHSNLSDGKSSPARIAGAAAGAGCDFLILADHGRPNRESLAAEGWKDRVLLLAGSELSTDRGHLVALNFRPPEGELSRRAQDAAREVGLLGGFTVIAHPYSKVRWSWGDSSDYAGIEIVNADSVFRGNLLRTLPYLPALLFKPGLPLLRTLGPPTTHLRKWDERNAVHPMFGYFSADAHVLYRPLFGFLHLHLLLEEPLSRDFEAARSQVFTALRRGRFYNAVEAAARARGFRFIGIRGEARHPMGDEIVLDPAGPEVWLRAWAPFGFRHEVRILRDGKVVAASEGKELRFEARTPGVYRAEVFLKERSPLGPNVPWILSNPVFLRLKGTRP